MWKWDVKISLVVHACKVTSVMSSSLWPYGPQPTRLLCPWDSPGKNTGVGCHALQGIFPTQGLNQGLLHCWWIFYNLSHQGSPLYILAPPSPLWNSSSVFFPEKSHGQRSLTGYSPWGHKELNMTEVTKHIMLHCIYAPQLLNPFISQWTSRLLPCPGYCKQGCNKHWGTCVF